MPFINRDKVSACPQKADQVPSLSEGIHIWIQSRQHSSPQTWHHSWGKRSFPPCHKIKYIDGIIFIKQLNRSSLRKSNPAVHWRENSLCSNLFKPLFPTLNISSNYFTTVLQDYIHCCRLPNVWHAFREKCNLWFCRIIFRQEEQFSNYLQKTWH